MPNGKMDTIEVDNAIVGEQWALSPGFKLLSQGLIETTDRASAGGDSHQRLGHFSHFLRTDPCHKHLRYPIGHLRFIATVAIPRPGYGSALLDLGGPQDLRWDRMRSPDRECRCHCGILSAQEYTLPRRLPGTASVPRA